jgi:hypothetical protein
MELDSKTILKFFMALFERMPGAAVLLISDGRRAHAVPRGAPIPFSDLQEAVSAGGRLTFSPLLRRSVNLERPVGYRIPLWVHFSGDPDPNALAEHLSSLPPAAIVSGGERADVYWRSSFRSVDEAVDAMQRLAAALGAVPGDPSEMCIVPLSESQVILPENPAELGTDEVGRAEELLSPFLIAPRPLPAEVRRGTHPSVEIGGAPGSGVTPEPAPARSVPQEAAAPVLAESGGPAAADYRPAPDIPPEPPQHLPSRPEHVPSPAGPPGTGVPFEEVNELVQSLASLDGLDPQIAWLYWATVYADEKIGQRRLLDLLAVDGIKVRRGRLVVRRGTGYYVVTGGPSGFYLVPEDL